VDARQVRCDPQTRPEPEPQPGGPRRACQHLRTRAALNKHPRSASSNPRKSDNPSSQSLIEQQ
jgi:hypothetical protein